MNDWVGRGRKTFDATQSIYSMDLGVVSLDANEGFLCPRADTNVFFSCERIETSRGVVVRVFCAGISMYLYTYRFILYYGVAAMMV